MVAKFFGNYDSFLTTKLSNLATVLWQWKREFEYESKKHCRDSINNRKFKNAVRIGLYCWVWAFAFCSFGGSMVRASDYNGTLKRREFEPWLRIFGFFFLTYIVSYYWSNVEKIGESNILNILNCFRKSF